MIELRYALFSFGAFICALSTVVTLATQPKARIRVGATLVNLFIVWLLIWGALS